jgi:tripartite-type tricarboxylate transporter receptor subunit TctC
LLGGQISVMFGGLATTFPNIRNGRTRALAISSLRRATVLPEVPTMAEAGLPGYEAIGWFALFAPAHTPGTVIHKINSETVAMFTQREIRERFVAQGAEFSTSTPAELDDRVRKEIAKWGTVIRGAGITPMRN